MMDRRHFLTASLAASTLPIHRLSPAHRESLADQQFFDLTVYHLNVGNRRNRVSDFMRDAMMPALQRLGIGPVGVFTVQYGETQPSLYVLTPHNSLESLLELPVKLAEDNTFMTDGADYLNAALSDPSYVRAERRLLKAFKDMPTLEAPEDLLSQGRIFELRTYEAHSYVAGQKKIDMFNEGGEIAIFRNVGLRPVFFGETLFGPSMPNLVYMLVFENMEERNAAWQRFASDPDWLELRANPIYKDTVSNISDIILRPTDYSQI